MPRLADIRRLDRWVSADPTNQLCAVRAITAVIEKRIARIPGYERVECAVSFHLYVNTCAWQEDPEPCMYEVNAIMLYMRQIPGVRGGVLVLDVPQLFWLLVDSATPSSPFLEIWLVLSGQHCHYFDPTGQYRFVERDYEIGYVFDRKESIGQDFYDFTSLDLPLFLAEDLAITDVADFLTVDVSNWITIGTIDNSPYSSDDFDWATDSAVKWNESRTRLRLDPVKLYSPRSYAEPWKALLGPQVDHVENWVQKSAVQQVKIDVTADKN
ncbi:unnamed protein product [Haemonchus placei]|uniref:DUF553 domain-containing protein n=1 Tax=Haemonchus placei TaxID=6290 RepID=A0A0N4X724_HAEPC|nr:unnamed protein product [Haemonchus placei]